MFQKYCCYTKDGDIIENFTYEIDGGYSWYVTIPRYGHMEYALKDTAFYVQKHIVPRLVLSKLPAGSRQAARGARICERNCESIIKHGML